jgi:DNA-3-methyladenine glycosylase II
MNKKKIISHFEKVDKKIYKIIKKLNFNKWKKVIKKDKDYFSGLTRSIISQQLSDKASSTIISRFEKLFPNEKINPKHVLKLSDKKLRSVGMSFAKASFIKDLSHKYLNKEVDFKNIKKMSDEKVAEQLLQVKGIGPWTVEMFLMFSLFRPNIFSHSDAGLKRAIKNLYGFKKEPSKSQVEKIVFKWHPYKTYGCFALWEILDQPKKK